LKIKLLKKFDSVLGLSLEDFKEEKDVPSEIWNLVKKRESARKEKNWELSDKIRKEVEKRGYKIEDTPEGPKIDNANLV